MMAILRIEHLSKSFCSKKVIDDLCFSVSKHSIFGFIGQNGAGKTTTMKMILGLIKPSKGTISVCGEKVTYGQTKTNRHIGYLSDVPAFYGYMKPIEYLKLCGQITGLSRHQIKSKSEELLTLVGLGHEEKKISTFSRGMKQRLGIAQALLNEPKLLICDEPTSALDPIGRKEILDILYKVKGKTTVVFSTHILSDVERICDYIALLDNGKLAMSGTLSKIKSEHQQNSLLIEFKTHTDKDLFLSTPSLMPYTMHREQKDTRIILHVTDLTTAQTTVLRVLYENNILPVKYQVLEPTLESLFVEVVK